MVWCTDECRSGKTGIVCDDEDDDDDDDDGGDVGTFYTAATWMPTRFKQAPSVCAHSEVSASHG